LDIVIFEDVVLTYIHAATDKETNQVLCLVASNKMSSWPSVDQLCVHRMACSKTWYWGLRIIVEKSIECYTLSQKYWALYKGVKVDIHILFSSTKCSVALTAMHWKPVAYLW